MLGVWPITSVEEREAVSFLILHLPTDGRVEVVIRKVWNHVHAPTDAAGEPYQTRGDHRD